MFKAMKWIALICALCAPFATPVAAQEDTTAEVESLSVLEQWQADPTLFFDAADVDLASLQFVARPLVVFANSPNDPRVAEQLDFLRARVDELVERDVIVIIDTDPAARTEVRQELRPRTFQLVLMDKNGRVHLRKPAPWDVREISRSIDKMPLRQQELGR